MFLRKRQWRKMQKYLAELEQRVNELENQFEYPNSNLTDTEFEKWILKKIWANADSVKRELYLFMGHLGYSIVTYSQKTVIEKIKQPKKGAK